MGGNIGGGQRCSGGMSPGLVDESVEGRGVCIEGAFHPSLEVPR